MNPDQTTGADRGGRRKGGPDPLLSSPPPPPPLKITKNIGFFSSKAILATPEKSQSNQASIQCWAIIGHLDPLLQNFWVWHADCLTGCILYAR